MATKTKTTKTALDTIGDNAKQAGVVLMTAAVTLGLVEVPHDQDKRAIMPVSPVFETAGVNNSGNNERREREETGPHYVSYGVSQRTPGRTGRV